MSSESPVPFTAPSQFPNSGSIVTRCAEHPDVETGLRCGRCETPICPKCMIMTPVGARCESVFHKSGMREISKIEGGQVIGG